MSTFTHDSLTPQERQAFARIVDALGYEQKIVLGRGRNSHPLERILTLADDENVLYGIVPSSRPPHDKGEVERYSLVVIRMREQAERADKPQRSPAPKMVAGPASSKLLAAFKAAGAAGLDRQEIHRVFGNKMRTDNITRLVMKLAARGLIERLVGAAREERWAFIATKKRAAPSKEEPAVITRHRRKGVSRSWEARKARWGAVGMSPEGLARRKKAYYEWVERRRAEKGTGEPLTPDTPDTVVEKRQKLFE